MGVKEAGRGLNNRSRTIVNQDLVEVTGRISDEGGEFDANILGLHVLGERERKLLLLASGDLNVVLDGSQVADDASISGAVLGDLLHGVERTGNEGDRDGVGILVVDLNDSLGRTPVDELNAEDFGLGEDGLDISVEGSLGGGIDDRSVLWRMLVQCCAIKELA